MEPLQASISTTGADPGAADSAPRQAGAVPTTSPVGAVPSNPRTNGPTKSPPQSASSAWTAVVADEPGRPTSYVWNVRQPGPPSGVRSGPPRTADATCPGRSSSRTGRGASAAGTPEAALDESTAATAAAVPTTGAVTEGYPSRVHGADDSFAAAITSSNRPMLGMPGVTVRRVVAAQRGAPTDEAAAGPASTASPVGATVRARAAVHAASSAAANAAGRRAGRRVPGGRGATAVTTPGPAGTSASRRPCARARRRTRRSSPGCRSGT